MIHRPATQADLDWMRKNLRPSVIAELSECGLDPDERWETVMSWPGIEISAIENNQGQCVALITVAKLPDEVRPKSGYVILLPSPMADEEPIGFLRAIKAWLAQAYDGKPYNELCSWVVDGQTVNYNMLAKFLHWKYEKPQPATEPNRPDAHLLYHRCEWLD